MPRLVKAYQCVWCTKTSRDFEHIKEHEEKCGWNPSQRSCETCMNSECKTHELTGVHDCPDWKGFYDVCKDRLSDPSNKTCLSCSLLGKDNRTCMATRDRLFGVAQDCTKWERSG